MDKFGIDLSTWQGNFDFDRAIKQDGVQFAILRGAYSCDTVANGGVDSRFYKYYAAAKERGLPIGVYQYSMAKNVEQARTEAKFLHDNVLKGRQFELPIYIDIEDASQRSLGKRRVTDIAKAWLSYLESLGYWVGIYSNTWIFRSDIYDQELQRYAHWVAQWDTRCDYSPASLVGMWQFGGETNLIRSNRIAGVICDQDYMMVDYPTLIKQRGLNGYSQSVQTTAGPMINVGDKVRITKGSKTFDGDNVSFLTYRRSWTVSEIVGDRVVLNGLRSAFKASDLNIVKG